MKDGWAEGWSEATARTIILTDVPPRFTRNSLLAALLLTPRSSALASRRSAKHNVDIKWFPCPDCDYKAKQTSHLKAHQKFKHGIGIEWFKCEDCAYKAKSLGNLKAHMRKRHDYEGYESVVIQEPIPSVGKKSKKGPGRLKKG